MSIMSNRRLFGAYLTEAKYESVRMLRAPGFAIPFLLLPAVLYLFFGVVLFGKELQADPKAALQTFAGFDVFGVMGPAMFGFGMVVAIEREQGLLTLKRAMPVPPASYLLAKVFMSMVFSGLITITMLAAALIFSHLHLTFAQCAGVAALNILGVAPFCSLGLFIGGRTTSKSAPAFVNLAYLAMIYLSDMLIPLPKSVDVISLAMPAFYLNRLVVVAAGAPGHAGAALIQLAVLCGVTVLFGALAVRRLARVG